MQPVSRTVGTDRVVGECRFRKTKLICHWGVCHTDEFVYVFTHDRIIDWLLPGVPPTGKKMSIPMMAVVNIRGDRLYNGELFNLVPYLTH
jgi:carboxymethylenebutenolidase